MKYEYRLLSYIHDTLRQESVNVGILFYSADFSFVKFGCRDHLTQLKNIFIGFDQSFLKESLFQLEKQISDYFESANKELNLHFSPDQFAQTLLPFDASALQWGRKGSGITDNLPEAFERLLNRYVLQATTSHSRRTRSDEQVWSTFSHELKQRNLLEKIKSITVKVAGINEELKHTYLNGAVHCLKPLSFDLTVDGLQDKVYKTSGWHDAIVKSNKDKKFQFYYLIGKPIEEDTAKTFKEIFELLKKEDTEIILEDDADKLPDILQRKAA